MSGNPILSGVVLGEKNQRVVDMSEPVRALQPMTRVEVMLTLGQGRITREQAEAAVLDRWPNDPLDTLA